jgi:hypothetical protein
LSASVSSTVGSPLTTRDTVFRLTPASAATSRMVARPGGDDATSSSAGRTGAAADCRWRDSGFTGANNIQWCQGCLYAR